MKHTEWLASIKPGDVITRWLAGTIPVRLKVSAVDDFIHCGPWKFSKRNGAEIDEELNWTEAMTGSFIMPDDWKPADKSHVTQDIEP